MVDLNNQILLLNYEEAEQEISRLIGLGYTDLILTFPILVNGEYNIDDMISKFNLFKVSFSGIRFYLGNEIHFHYTLLHRLKQKDILSLNQSKYLLIKLPEKTFPDQFKQLIKALEGYKVILSCPNRYHYYSSRDLQALKNEGVLFFVPTKELSKPRSKQLIKKELIDFVGTYETVTEWMQQRSLKHCSQHYIRALTYDNFKEIINLGL